MPLVTVGSRKVYCDVYGEAHPGIPLVLVMGVGGSCNGWLPLQVPEFAAARRTVIYDHRGVRESDDPGGSFTTGDLADDLAKLLDALEIEKADVLGAFMGGMVAQELALRHSARLERLVLVGTWARPDAKRKMLLEQWRDLARADNSIQVLVRERLLWTLQDETLEQRDLIDSMIEFFEKDGAPFTNDLFARQCEACLAHDTADRLRRIPHRTLVVCGRRDALTPPHFHRELADELPNAHLVTMGYGGHIVMVESAPHFNRTVLQFLAEGRPPSGGASGA
jgi:aminoacrylate hydrolase